MRVWWKVFQASVQTRFEYHWDVILRILGAFMVQMSALGFLWVVIHQAGDINGWPVSQVLLLMGLVGMGQGISELLFDNVWRLPSIIVRGDLDRLLVYPVRTLPFLMISYPEIHSIGNFGMGLVFTVTALAINHAGPAAWLLVPVWAVCTCLTYTSILLVAASVSFSALGPGDYLYSFYHLFHANRYPLSAYPKVMQFIFLFIVPFGACIFVPGEWVTGRITGWWWGLLPVPVAGICMVAAILAWKAGLKRYESAGA